MIKINGVDQDVKSDHLRKEWNISQEKLDLLKKNGYTLMARPPMYISEKTGFGFRIGEICHMDLDDLERHVPTNPPTLAFLQKRKTND